MPIVKPEIAFKAKIPERPAAELDVFELKAPGIRKRTVRQIAEQLNLRPYQRGGEWTRADDWLSYQEGAHRVAINTLSGGIKYADISRFMVDDGKSQCNLSDEDAVKISKSFISEQNLAPKNELRFLKVTHLNVGSCKADGSEREDRVIDCGVIFGRKIGNIPVNGPGGKIAVYISHDRTIVAFDKIWRDIKRKKATAKVEKPDYARRKFKLILSKVLSKKRAAPAKVEVNQATFGFFEQGFRVRQKYLQPAYIFHYILRSMERASFKSVKVIPASRRVYEMFEKRKKPITQPIRTS